MFIAFSLEGMAKLMMIRFAHNPILFVLFSGLIFFAWGKSTACSRLSLVISLGAAMPRRIMDYCIPLKASRRYLFQLEAC